MIQAVFSLSLLLLTNANLLLGAQAAHQKDVYLSRSLIDAARKGNFIVVRDLLKYPNIDVNMHDEKFQGMTALLYAASDGYLSIVKALLQHPGINVNIQDNRGYTALMLATQKPENASESFMIVQALLARKDIRVNLQQKDGNTAFMYASAYMNEKCAQALRAHGAK